MSDCGNPANVYERTQALVGYVPRQQASSSLYHDLGFRCGLEVHQQLRTQRKLFCRCPAGRYQRSGDYDAQVVRHMRPTLSELGEYDGTALMEFKTRKNIIYRICGETACTYDIDDTPPFAVNREALSIAIEIALLLGTQIVGELHITRKQYLDGSIPTGFQRTAIVGIHGEIPLSDKSVRIIQLSIEEDSCREVSDLGHVRTYTTDRLGMPLVETVTYPDMTTPSEAAEAAHHIRFLTRSTRKVNVGIGAAREDVNVSIRGGTRVEIKGVQRIRWIPDLTHNEAFRQKSLLALRAELLQRVPDPESWKARSMAVAPDSFLAGTALQDTAEAVRVVNLPGFAGILSFFTNPGRCFADELSDRVKVVACIDKPNLAHSDEAESSFPAGIWRKVREELHADAGDGQVLVWGPAADMNTAVETIEERCRLAFQGVPNETRKALPNGTTLFERVLPGPDRMYPDTDSAPIPIDERVIEQIRASLPSQIDERRAQLRAWGIPNHCWTYVLKRDLFPLIDQLVREEALPPALAGRLVGQDLRHARGDAPGEVEWLIRLVRSVRQRGLHLDILPVLLPHASDAPGEALDSLLARIGYVAQSANDVYARLESICAAFRPHQRSPEDAHRDWVMGQLRPMALGNVSLAELSRRVEEEAGR